LTLIRLYKESYGNIINDFQDDNDEYKIET